MKNKYGGTFPPLSLAVAHLNVRRNRSGRSKVHQSVGEGKRQRVSVDMQRTKREGCRRARDGEHSAATVVVVPPQPSAVVPNQISLLPFGGPHYDP